MKVITKEVCYQGNGLRNIGDVFELPGNPKKLSRALVRFDGPDPGEGSGSSETEPVKEPTKAEIISQLSAAGVAFDLKANKPELLAILKDLVVKTAPGAKVDTGMSE